MKPTLFAMLLPLTLLGLAACDEDTSDPGDEGPYTLTFAGDASFQGAHGGQTIRIALVSGSATLATDEGTVSSTGDPSFSFTFRDALEAGQSYEVRYWIDSNLGGGTAMVCDDVANDHQWSVAVPSTTEDVVLTDSHRPTEAEDVCDTFAADLTFQGDASFQGPHGGQSIQAGVVASDGSLIIAQSGTVSSSTDPSFSFEFPGAMLLGQSYQVHYWIDSNFGDGTAGTCDEVGDDHQWSADLGLIMDDSVTQTEAHDAGNQTAVCSTFE